MKNFKYKNLSTILLLLYTLTAHTQSFNHPESITFDDDTDAFFVSNTQTGDIHIIDEQGKISKFVSGYSSFLGIKVHHGIIYGVENIKNGDDFIRGFSIKTAKQVFSVSILGTRQLNDLEVDNKGNLYVSDRGGSKIYKISLKDSTYELIDTTIQTPNGLYFNMKNNSLLVCNTLKKSSIYEIDLERNNTKLLVDSDYPNLDGITLDKNGVMYLTSWSLDWKQSILLKYDGTKFEELLINSSGMADIEYNKKNHTLEIAKYWDNAVMSYKLN